MLGSVKCVKIMNFRYVRCLGAFYLRLTGTAIDCYNYLEPLYNDYRKVRQVYYYRRRFLYFTNYEEFFVQNYESSSLSRGSTPFLWKLEHKEIFSTICRSQVQLSNKHVAVLFLFAC